MHGRRIDINLFLAIFNDYFGVFCMRAENNFQSNLVLRKHFNLQTIVVNNFIVKNIIGPWQSHLLNTFLAALGNLTLEPHII